MSINQVLTFFTVPPGNLIYHLVLVASILGALYSIIMLWIKSQHPHAVRTILGLGILLGLQGTLFIVSVIAARGFLNPESILPPLDRAVTFLSLIWIAWLWVFPEPSKIADAGTLILSFLGVIFLGLSLVVWSQWNLISFQNHSLLDFIWQVISILVVILAIVLLALRQPDGWGIGLAIFILALVGHAITLLIPTGGDFPGAVRFVQLAMFPLLLALPHRFPSDQKNTQAVVDQPAVPGTTEKHLKIESSADALSSHGTDPNLFHALLQLAGEPGLEGINSTLTRSVAEVTGAEMCYLVAPDGENNLKVVAGYNLNKRKNMEGRFISAESYPLLLESMKKGKSLRLSAESTSVDLKKLGQSLGLGNAGHLLTIPLVSKKHGTLGSVFLVNSQSKSPWSSREQNFLNDNAPLFVSILERGQHVADLEQERNTAALEAETARKKADEISASYESVKQTPLPVKTQLSHAALLAEAQQESQKLIDQLKAENLRLRETGGADGISAAQAEHELRLALQEIAHMQNTLAEVNIRILELERRPGSSKTGDQAEVLASISQELRQPMSSIIGYTDLLLGESIGILGNLQRKFVERIKASTERIGSLVDDLIQITTLEAAYEKIKPEPVDMNLIIDNAVAYTSTQIREKNITLQLDMPDLPAPIQTDREALQQILIHLLQNAGAATPAEGTIGLHIQIQKQDDKDYLQIQVTDNGGGIAPEDVEHVFQRRYRADHALILGLGDTTVGLSIAKSLVDAQNGRIWVDSVPGVGSTFSVLLPVNQPPVSDEA